jgi:hypothetical protein
VDRESGSVQTATQVAQRLWCVPEAVNQEQRPIRASIECEALGSGDDAIGARRPRIRVRALRPSARTNTQHCQAGAHREEEWPEHQPTRRMSMVNTGASKDRPLDSIGRFLP